MNKGQLVICIYNAGHSPEILFFCFVLILFFAVNYLEMCLLEMCALP